MRLPSVLCERKIRLYEASDCKKPPLLSVQAEFLSFLKAPRLTGPRSRDMLANVDRLILNSGGFS